MDERVKRFISQECIGYVLSKRQVWIRNFVLFKDDHAGAMYECIIETRHGYIYGDWRWFPPELEVSTVKRRQRDAG